MKMVDVHEKIFWNENYPLIRSEHTPMTMENLLQNMSISYKPQTKRYFKGFKKLLHI